MTAALAMVRESNSMTSEEKRRLATLEVKNDYNEKAISSMVSDIKEIKELLLKGKGAYWAFLKFSAWFATFIVIAASILEHLPAWIKN